MTTAPTPGAPRAIMNGKPVFTVPAKHIINMHSGFEKKLLCDGPTFNAGTACAYTCAFCYVPSQMEKSPHLAEAHAAGLAHEDVVIRREGALEALRSQLVGRHGINRFGDPSDQRVIYSSTTVDVAPNMELVRETVDLCWEILLRTHWQIRLLSKSNMLPKVAQGLEDKLVEQDCNPASRAWLAPKRRVIYGVSTGTLDNKVAAAFEEGTPLVSKRIQSLRWLQDNGFRTFGMICPSLPQRDYTAFAYEMYEAIRGDLCEHVWAEVINVRGESMVRTVNALEKAGYGWEASALAEVSMDKAKWESYSRATFEGHVPLYTHAPGKLRFLQYVHNDNRAYWQPRQYDGAVLL